MKTKDLGLVLTATTELAQLEETIIVKDEQEKHTEEQTVTIVDNLVMGEKNGYQRYNLI
jgi:hypothetical protein